jgi:hypothetical protein
VGTGEGEADFSSDRYRVDLESAKGQMLRILEAVLVSRWQGIRSGIVSDDGAMAIRRALRHGQPS